MIVVVADTAELLAALDESHPDGDGAREVPRTAGTLIICPVLLSEMDHVARRVLGPDAAHQAIDDISHWVSAGRAVLPVVTSEIIDTAQAVRTRYKDLHLDLADAVNVAVAADFRTNAALTLDGRYFRAIRPLSDHLAFLLLPDDH